jgi:CMP-N-acetylneuraminic acid synthetase
MSNNSGAVLGVILARGGSQRVPRKNIKELGGRPLIAWTIEAAKNAKSLDYCLVSTNDDEIRKIAKQYGGHAPFKRPAKLGEDVDSILPTIHAIRKFEKKKQRTISHVVMLQPTSPFRTPEDIDRCVQIAKTTGVDTVLSVTKVSQHPYWMFSMKPFGHELESFLNIDLEGDNLVSQNLPLLFYPNGAVYVIKRDVAMSGRIFGEKIYGYMMPAERSIDLEVEYDFLIAGALIPYLQSTEPFAQISWVIP